MKRAKRVETKTGTKGILGLVMVAAMGTALAGCNTGSRTPNTAPTIGSSPVTTATVGQAYRYELQASGRPDPVAITARNLPSWLTLNGNVLEGTPSLEHLGVSGRIALIVSNGTEPDARQVFRISVSHDGPLFSLAPSATAGTLVAPAGTVATDYVVHSAFGQATPNASGAFSVPTTGQPQLVWATRGGRLTLLSVLNTQAFGGQLSARSTAATLTWLNVGAGATPATLWNEGLERALADGGLAGLQTSVTTNASSSNELLTGVSTALGASSRALAGTLNTAADAASAPVNSNTGFQQTHRVTPALPRSGVMVDTGGERLLNDRRRTTYVAITPQTATPTLDDYAALPPATPGSSQASLDTFWKASRSEGGVSLFTPSTDFLGGLEEAYQVVFVGSSFRSAEWPATGTIERQLVRRGITADAGRHYTQTLALALGFSPEALRGGLNMIVDGAAREATLAGLALELDLPASDAGLWNLIDVYARAVGSQPSLQQPYERDLRACVGGLDDAYLAAARGIVSQLAAGQRALKVSDSPATLYQEASNPVERFVVDPGQSGSNNGLTIVLEWGQNPSDLDSHLLGPNGLHLYYPNARGNSPDPSHVSLDLDDTSSFGPETTAILDPRAGAYRFAVYNFSDGSNPNSTGLSTSRATVKVYQGSNPVPLATFPAPQGQQGNVWLVFDYDGASGVITPLNQVDYVSSDTAIPAP